MTEKKEAAILAEKLCAPLDAGNPTMAARFLKGGYQQDGYGVPEGAAIDGSHAFKGTQGYYVKNAAGDETGKKVFMETVGKMKIFFKRRAQRTGKPIRYVIKPGIGGQHTPFQAIADGFEASYEKSEAKIAGEYELGKDFEAAMSRVLGEIDADWDQIAVIPSSKSGSTDETMLIFVDIFYILLKHAAEKEGLDGARFADQVLEVLHEINFAGGQERAGKDLFKIESGSFLPTSQLHIIFGKVLGNMFFETTDRPEQSRLSAFVRNSGLDKELGEDAPGFGAMFDNVGGRWTGDLHMMTFLAFFDLDAEAYWKAREQGIREVREGKHPGHQLAHKILDEGITDITLLVPDYLFWFGKAMEQNFNESIWQKGFANLVTVRESEWPLAEKYCQKPKSLVIKLTDMKIGDFRKLNRQEIALAFAGLFTTFYGLTNTAGTRLMARALHEAGFKAQDADLNNLDCPATKIVQQNLFLRQPYVELGKGLLEKRLKTLQEEETKTPGAIFREYARIKKEAGLTSVTDLKQRLDQAIRLAESEGRKLVPFLYIEGLQFHEWRDRLLEKGIVWVMQGTGDQHISYQQVLAQPKRYFVLFISFVSENPLPGRPAIGFAKGYLHRISSHLVRDLFAEASYHALTDLRAQEGGLGFFLRLFSSPQTV